MPERRPRGGNPPPGVERHSSRRQRRKLVQRRYAEPMNEDPAGYRYDDSARHVGHPPQGPALECVDGAVFKPCVIRGSLTVLLPTFHIEGRTRRISLWRPGNDSKECPSRVVQEERFTAALVVRLRGVWTGLHRRGGSRHLEPCLSAVASPVREHEPAAGEYYSCVHGRSHRQRDEVPEVEDRPPSTAAVIRCAKRFGLTAKRRRVVRRPAASARRKARLGARKVPRIGCARRGH